MGRGTVFRAQKQKKEMWQMRKNDKNVGAVHTHTRYLREKYK